LVISLGTVVGLLVAAIVGFALLLNHNLSNIKHVPITIPAASRPTPDQGKALNILLLGADAGSAREPGGNSILVDAASGSWPPGKYRSDATMLMHVDANRKHAYVVSIPRDSYLDVYDSTGQKRETTKVNAALSLYGPSGAISTIENFSTLRVNHLAMLDWDGFEAITNALGGVKVTIPGHGEVNLKGKPALTYVRERHSLPGGDFGRVKRQQNFLRSLMTKIVNRGTLTNPIRLNNTLSSITSNLAVEDGWSSSGIRSLAISMRGIRPSNVTFMTLPTKGTASDPIAGSIVVVDKRASADLFDAMRTDDVASFVTANRGLVLGGPTTVN